VNVLVVAPHPDDEAIGCGGAICLHAERGDKVSVIFLTSGELGLRHLPPSDARRIREAEAEEAATILGVTSTGFLRQPDWFLNDRIDQTRRLVDAEVARTSPDLIYSPHGGEWHPDHQAASTIAAGLAVVAHGDVKVWGYEVWTPLATFEAIENISSVMARKLQAVRAYGSQLDEFRYDRAVEGLNQYRGALAAHVDFAEVFAIHHSTVTAKIVGPI